MSAAVGGLRSADLTDDAPIKPWQRLATLMYVSGTPLHDVAKEMNTEVARITEFISSPKGTALLKTLLSENAERMTNMIEATIVDTLMTIINIRDRGKTEGSRLAACNQLLDRYLPKLKATDKGAGRNNDSSQFTDVQGEIAKLRAELAGDENSLPAI